MRGTETAKNVESRFEVFHNLWLPQEEALRV